MSASTRQGFFRCDTDDPMPLASSAGQGVLLSNRSIDKDRDSTTAVNEDAAGFWDLGDRTVVMAVADGLGGGPAGSKASEIAIQCLDSALADHRDDSSPRAAILDAFESANDRVLDLGIGAGTTLVAVEVRDGLARAFHAGDSSALLVGQRGRVGFETTPHSPVGYAVASGMIEPEDSHHREDRHLLSNCIGSREMRVEIGAAVEMNLFDTLVLASDGVTDNLPRPELIDLIRQGPLDRAAEKVRKRVHEVMSGGHSTLPAHPDDVTLILFRRRRK